jgi:uncharacterized protein (TIRG00374 family)
LRRGVQVPGLTAIFLGAVLVRMSGQGPGETSRQSRSPRGAKGRLAGRRAQSRPLTWKLVLRRGAALAVTGLAIYLVLPSLTRVLASWPQLARLEPAWLAASLLAEVASFMCYFGLLRLGLRTRAWFSVVTAALTGNAISCSVPGGAAAGAAVQYEMLAAAGFNADTSVEGLAAISLLNLVALLGLPLLALPAILGGIAASADLVHAAEVGAGGFVLLAAAIAVALRADWPLAAVGRALQWLRNRLPARNRPPVTGLDTRLLADRDSIRQVLGREWRQAVLLTAGRVGCDFGCLLAALTATGARPHPSLVLLAYAAANIITLFPITPGGLGIVEASLAGLLILAGVRPGAAFVATLAYRLASYWLPLAAGIPAYALFRHRYGPPGKRSSAATRH